MILDEVCFGIGIFEDLVAQILIMCILLGAKIKYSIRRTLGIIFCISVVEMIVLYPMENRDAFMIIMLLVSTFFVASSMRQSLLILLPSVICLSIIQTTIYAIGYILVGWENTYANSVLSSLLTLLLVLYVYRSHKIIIKNNYSLGQLLLFNIVSIALSVLIAEVQSFFTRDNSLLKKDGFSAMMHNSILVLCIVLCVLAFYLGVIQRKLNEAKQIAKEKEFLLNAEREHMETVIRSEERLHAFKHDLIAHLNALSSYAEEGNVEKVKDYCENLLENSSTFKRVSYTGNPAVDGVLGQLKSMADERGVELDIKMTLQKEKKITDYDLCILISNILKNAIEANNPGGKVEIKTWPFNENVCIFSSNTTTHPLNYKKGVLISTKRDGKTPGYGMRNIEAVVEKYDGDFQIKEDGGLVKIEAMV